MKLLVINPNISESVTRLITAEAERAASPGTVIEAHTAECGVAYIETRAEAAVGAYATLCLLAEHYEGCDAAVIAAFGDPGVNAAKEILPIPVVGLTEAALASACLAGGRFSIIAISQRIRAWYRETVEACGLLGRLASIRSLQEPLADIGAVQRDQGEKLVALCNEAVANDRADSIILAGAPLAGLARDVADRLPVPVVDGVASAARHAESMAAMGVADARGGSFAVTPEKDWRGLPASLGGVIGRKRS